MNETDVKNEIKKKNLIWLTMIILVNYAIMSEHKILR